MQLRLDAADRLVELVEERRGAVPVEDAARALFALQHLPEGMARSLLDDVIGADARLAWRGSCVALAGGTAEARLLEEAAYCVVDLETTGLSPGRSQICEIGAVRIEALKLAVTLQTLVNPRERLPLQIASLTGIDERDLRSAPHVGTATARFLEFAGDAVLVAHNARFDMAFLDAAVLRLGGRRLAAPVVDTVWLARRLLAGRASRFGLASLAQFFGTGTRPCHRALPDAEATAEILLNLIGLAQERGARTVADLLELSAPRRRRVYGKRSLAFGAPTLPGVYLFLDAHGQVLYVGRARDLRARLRSYFRSERQRPALEAALSAVASIEWRVLGSELEAALEELRLLRELRPPANARSTRPDTASSSHARRRPMGRSRAAAVPSSPPARSRSASWSSRGQPCRGCGASSHGSPISSGTRTRRACATGSRPSRQWRRTSRRSTDSAHSNCASPRLRVSPDSRGCSLSPKVVSRQCGRRRKAAGALSSLPVSRPHDEVRFRHRAKTQTNCSSSLSSCGGRRLSCASSPSATWPAARLR